MARMINTFIVGLIATIFISKGFGYEPVAKVEMQGYNTNTNGHYFA